MFLNTAFRQYFMFTLFRSCNDTVKRPKNIIYNAIYNFPNQVKDEKDMRSQTLRQEHARTLYSQCEIHAGLLCVRWQIKYNLCLYMTKKRGHLSAFKVQSGN